MPYRRHSSDRVTSLFGKLEAVEQAMVDNQKAFLDALDDDNAVSGLATLQQEAETLDREANHLVRAIREAVESSSALAVFARQVDDLRDSDGTVAGRSGMGADSALQAMLHDNRRSGSVAAGVDIQV